MNDILHDIETAELQTFNTIKIITNLQETIAKLSQDDVASANELSQFEEEAEYLKKLVIKIADGLPPAAPNSSSISLAEKFAKNKTKAKSIAVDTSPKFIKAKPKYAKSTREKSQQTVSCDKKSSKKKDSSAKKRKHKKPVLEEPEGIVPKSCMSNLLVCSEPTLQPTKYLQHTLIPFGKTKPKNLSTESMPGDWQHMQLIYEQAMNQKTHFKQVNKPSGVEHFAKMMQLCMNVKQERESDLQKQIFTLEEEMQTVMESNKNLYSALEKLEQQNSMKKPLMDSSTNTLTDITQSSCADSFTDLPLDEPFQTSEEFTNDLAEDIIKCIHADIKEITSNIAKTKSQTRLIFKEHDKLGKPKYEYGKHVSFLENAITSMQNKLETAQNKQFELAIQSKAVVEAAYRMTSEAWTY